MSEGNGKFFCFSLGMLSFDPEPVATLSAIIDVSVHRMAEMAYGDESLEQLKAVAESSGAYHNSASRPKGVTEYRLLLAANALSIVYHGGLLGIERSVRIAQAHLAQLSPGARNNTIQIKPEFVWSCMETIRGGETRRSLSWREFRVLCAILSKVGAKGVKKCGWLEIQARAAAFCGKRDMERAPDHLRHVSKQLLLSRSQIRTTLERLERDQFFARFNYGSKGRESWFSFSMSVDELRAEVVRRKQHASKVAERRQADRAVIDAVHQRIANINTGATDAGGIANINSVRNAGSETPMFAPTNHQPIANVIANPIANINKNNLNKNDCNKNNLKEHTPAAPAPFVLEFSVQDQKRWPEFIKREGFEGAPMQFCPSLHGKFRGYLDATIACSGGGEQSPQQ